jgi:hypothetical protein
VIFGAALVGVPVGSLILIGYELTDTSGRDIVGVGLPAAAGVAAGATLLALLRALEARTEGLAARGPAIGSSLIVVAAVAGTSSSALPTSVVAFVDGAVLGFFLAFDIVLVNLWRRDAAFRSRITRAWRGE